MLHRYKVWVSKSVPVWPPQLSGHLGLKDHSNEVQTYVKIHFMLVKTPDCFTCLFSWYGLLITVGGVGGDFSVTRSNG